MSLSNSVVYLIGAALIVAALLIVLPRRGHSFRARDVTGNTLVGNVNGGSVSQGAAAHPAALPTGNKAKSRPDKVAWIIATIGVLVALAQLAHDVIASK